MGVLKALLRSNNEDQEITCIELDNRFKRYVIKNQLKASAISSREDCRTKIKVLCDQAREFQKKYYYVPSLVYELLTQFSLVEHNMYRSKSFSDNRIAS